MTLGKGLEWKPLKPYLLLLKVLEEIYNIIMSVLKEVICLISLILSNTDYAQQPVYIVFTCHKTLVNFKGFAFMP